MRTYLLRFAVVRFLAATASGLGFTGNAFAADAANTIRYGIDDEQNINRLPQVIAEREGLFAREGLKVELIRFRSAFRTGAAAQTPGGNQPTVREAMAQGRIDMTREQLPLLIRDVMTGQKFVGVAVASNNPVYFFVGRPEINSFADFKGKTVAITSAQDGITVWTRKLLALHGLKDDDVKLKDIAGSEGRVACLKSGECAAAALDQRAISAALDARGYVFGITNEVAPMLYQVDIANPDWAAAHRDLVAKYIRATAAAMRFIEDPKNRYETLDVVKELTKLPEGPSRDMLAYIWDPRNRVFRTSAPDMNNVQAMISLLGEFEVLKQPLPAPEHFVDPSYAKAAGVQPGVRPAAE